MADLRYAARMLAKSPGFTLAVVCLLAVGIGANTAIFSALNAILLRTLPVRQPQELIRLVQYIPRVGVTSSFRHEFYEALKQARTISVVFGDAEWPVAMNDPKPAEQVRVHVVTPEFFDALGVPALYGRTLSTDDERESGGLPPAVLSYGFWMRRFAGDVQAVGRTLSLRGHKFLIVGVMPRAFNGITVDTAPDLRIPMRTFPLISFDASFRADKVSLEIAARLKPGVSLKQARAECFTIWRAVTEQALRAMPNMTEDRVRSELSDGLQVESLDHGYSVLRDRFGPALQLLAGSAGLLLLLMCSNVAGLLIARGAGRRNEIAVRLALGATRTRLMRQMLTESALLAVLGALGGWLVASICMPLLAHALPPMRDRATTQLALSLDIAPDTHVLLFAIGVSALTALLFGLAPAFAAARVSLDGVLRGVRSTRGSGYRASLVVFQVALCTLLLAGAGLLVRSFRQLNGLNPGFDRGHIVSFTAAPSISGYTQEQCEKLRRALLDRIRAMPDVVSAATASRAVMRGSGVKFTILPEGQKPGPADSLNTSLNGISPEYCETMGMRILAGRGLRDEDDGVKPVRALVNETFARRYFPGGDAVGRRLGYGEGQRFEIVGVVSDAKYRSLREPVPPTLYDLFSRVSDDSFVLYVRTRARPDALIQPVRRALAALDPALPFIEVHTLAEEVEASTAAERVTAELASLFALLAATLAALGIYGLLSYGVAQRHREIGIRMAIGARSGDIGWMIGRQALALVALGVAAGLGAMLVLAPAIRSLLYGVAPLDGVSLFAAAAFVIAVSALATAIPAMRATRIQPAFALRDD